MPVQARNYQNAACKAIMTAWGEQPWFNEALRKALTPDNPGEGELDLPEPHRSCLLNIPTSAGKTVISGLIARKIVERKMGKFLYLADRDELCRQPRKMFEELLGLKVSVEKAKERADRSADIVIASLQTLAQLDTSTDPITYPRLKTWPEDHFKYIFVDEAHRDPLRAKVVTDYFKTAKVCGQTATAFRAKMIDLSDYYETVAYEIGVFDLIEDGYIVPIKVQTLPVEIDISDVKQSQVFGERDYNLDELGNKIEPYYQRICELLLEHCAGRQIIAFHPLISSSEKFITIARANGINARHIDHKSKDREELQVAFEEKQFQLLSCSTLLYTGWDCPPCDTLLNLSPTRSPGMWRQKVGRILRVLPGVVDGIPTAEARKAAIAQSEKPYALILDLLYHADRFGLQGAPDLIAEDEDDRDAIADALARGAEEKDLQDVSDKVRADREAKIVAELEEIARRKAEAEKRRLHPAQVGLIAANQVGAMLHESLLINYQAVSRWQMHPKTDKQREYLLRQGIDPDTVQNKGHASLLTEKLWARRQVGLCSLRTLVALVTRKVEGARHYSEEQAYAFLQFDYPFPFGKPAREGKTFRQTSYGYWKWLSEQDWVRKGWPVVWTHLTRLGLADNGRQTTFDDDLR